jgi:predicted component of type VI protein secretion system
MSILTPIGFAYSLAKEFGHSFEQFVQWVAEVRGVELTGGPAEVFAKHGYDLTDEQHAHLLKLIRDNVPTDYVSRERKWSRLQARLQADPFLKAQRDGWGS